MSKRFSLAGFVVVLLLGASALAQDTIGLHFDLYRNGSLIADRSVTVQDGEMGTFTIENAAVVKFTPTRAGDRTAVVFTIESAGKAFNPRLVLSRQRPGKLSWTSAEGTVELRVAVQ